MIQQLQATMADDVGRSAQRKTQARPSSNHDMSNALGRGRSAARPSTCACSNGSISATYLVAHGGDGGARAHGAAAPISEDFRNAAEWRVSQVASPPGGRMVVLRSFSSGPNPGRAMASGKTRVARRRLDAGREHYDVPFERANPCSTACADPTNRPVAGHPLLLHQCQCVQGMRWTDGKTVYACTAR